MARFTDWGHWGLTFWEGERDDHPQAIAALPFPVGPCGPCDGWLGSPEREALREKGRLWTERGELPEGAQCDIYCAWLYDAACPKARWMNGRWVSPTRSGQAWVFQEVR